MHKQTDELFLLRHKLAKEMVSEIILSDAPEGALKKWRNIFEVPQKTLAGQLQITSSVVSDYESGRRKNPGIRIIRKYVSALLDLDQIRGGVVIRGFAKNVADVHLSDAIIDIKEFAQGVPVEDFCRSIGASLLTHGTRNHHVYGYTVIDSLKAITEFSFQEMIKLYGLTTQRGLIFTKLSTGRTPMVAIKLTNLHPALVVLHGISVVDDIAKRIAEAENIPLAVTRIEKVEDVVEGLKAFD
ncbi:MAG: transcriptional regulator [Candidatus Aenigmarchaeota archaeon]|nr:transcriptional regulator [Candidatus Aenigmarchaeota archaeon]